MKRLGIAGLLALALLVGRVAWGTVYYMDKTKTGGTRSGLDTTNAFTDIDSCLSDLGAYPALAAGDTIKIRTTHTQTLGSNVDIANDGTASNPIVVKGDYNHLIWHSAADSASDRPTFKCGAYYFNHNTDDWWEYNGIAIDSITAYGIYYRSGPTITINNCAFTRPYANDDIFIGALDYVSSYIYVNNCTFSGNVSGTNYGVGVRGTSAEIVACTFDDMYTGVNCAGGIIYTVDCAFGQSSSNTTDCGLGSSYNAQIYNLNATMNDNSGMATSYMLTLITRTYLDAAKRPMLYFENGYLPAAISDYSVTHPGGAAYSIKYSVTSSNVGTKNPVKLMEFSVHADSAEARDYTLSCRRDTNWDTMPTAAKLYVECTYTLNDTTATAVSTATLTNANTWYDLTVSGVSPSHKGPVVVALWLKTYDSNGYIYVDPELVATGENYNATFNWGLPDLAYAYTGTSSASRFILVN
jgi:hypothetical protein